MGGCDFITKGSGWSAEDAFSEARSHAEYEHGHGGYTGTIAEKHGFKIRHMPEADITRLIEERRATLIQRRKDTATRPLQTGERFTPAWIGDEGERTRRLADIDDNLTDANLRRDAIMAWVERDLHSNDKHGPAYCVVLREPDAPMRLTKAAAEKKAKEVYGEGTVITVGPNGKLKMAQLTKTVPGSRPGPEFTTGSYVTGANGCTYGLASASAADADEARGALFRKKGEYLFYGIASS